MMSVLREFPVEVEYKKNPDISPDDIAKLRAWLQTQPHLPEKYLTDLDLILVYHCCERSSEVSKQVLDLHYTLRTIFTGLFKDRELDRKTEFNLQTVLFAPLPTPTVHGYRAVYARLIDPDPRNFHFSDTIRTFMMMFDMWQYEEGTWPGFVLMIDMDQSVIGHIAKLDVMTVRQVLYFLQECMLVKLKGVHFLNAPSFMDKVMMILKPFIKASLMGILHIHQVNSNTIYEHVPKIAFPKNEGGEYKDHNTIRDELIKRFQVNQSFIRDENRRRVNESLRPGGKKTTVEDLFGIQGSFKKLDID